MKRSFVFRTRPGEGTPLTLAIVLVLLMTFCAVSEYARIWIIARGVREATQDAVLSAVNDNYNDIYHAAREGYAAGWYPNDGDWTESVDEGDVYGHMARALGLNYDGDKCIKVVGGQVEYTVSDLEVYIENNGIASGQSEGYTAVAVSRLVVPVRFLGNMLPAADMTIKAMATYIPLF